MISLHGCSHTSAPRRARRLAMGPLLVALLSSVPPALAAGSSTAAEADDVPG